MSRTVSRTLSLLGAAALTLGALALPARAQDAPAGDAANGKKVYMADGCYLCHGSSGQGGGYNQPTPVLAKTQMPFDGFKNQLRNPIDDMPPYAEAVMTDQQIADIYAFVQSLPGRSDPKAIPLLNN